MKVKGRLEGRNQQTKPGLSNTKPPLFPVSCCLSHLSHHLNNRMIYLRVMNSLSLEVFKQSLGNHPTRDAVRCDSGIGNVKEKNILALVQTVKKTLFKNYCSGGIAIGKQDWAHLQLQQRKLMIYSQLAGCRGQWMENF